VRHAAWRGEQEACTTVLYRTVIRAWFIRARFTRARFIGAWSVALLGCTLTGCSRAPEQVALPPPGAAQAAAPGSPVTTPARPGMPAGMPAGTASSPISWNLRTVGSTQMRSVIAAYAAYVDVYVRLAGAPDPTSPLIATVSTGAARRALETDLRGLAAARRALAGPVRLAPAVAQLRGSTAVVEDCADLSHFADTVSAKVGSAAQPIRAELTVVAGRWAVSAVSRPARSCR
jgi:hypothetical protein